MRLATAKRIDGNRGESASDGDLVEAALTLSSCEHEGHDHQISWALSAADECPGTPRIVSECSRWVRWPREATLMVRPQAVLSTGAYAFIEAGGKI